MNSIGGRRKVKSSPLSRETKEGGEAFIRKRAYKGSRTLEVSSLDRRKDPFSLPHGKSPVCVSQADAWKKRNNRLQTYQYVFSIHSHLAAAWPGSGRRSGEKTPPPFSSLLCSSPLHWINPFLRYVEESRGGKVSFPPPTFPSPGASFFPVER